MENPNVLIYVFFALCAAYAILAVLFSFFYKKGLKLLNYIGIPIIAVCAVLMLIFIPAKKDKYQPLSTAGMYIFSILLIGIIAALTVFSGKDKGTASPTKSTAFAGICVALSFALSYVKLFSLPQGGSVTLASMLPLILYAYIFGARKGLLAGIVYGVLQIIQSPQIYQPMQVLLDYPIAFGAIGLAGVLKNCECIKSPLVKFILGASIALTARYAAHFLSGYYVFSSWAMEGYTALSWSLVYNLFVFVELAIVLVVGVFAFSSKSLVRELDKINPSEAKFDSTNDD